MKKELVEGICHAIHKYAEGNNKYMKNYGNMYLDSNNLYEWAMSQKLPVNDFKWKKMDQSLMKALQKIMSEIPKKDIFLK